METENVENKNLETVKKATINIDDYKKQFESLVIDGERSIEDAESLKSQVKAAKSQVNAATKLDWQRKKKAWDDSKEDTKKKKAEYEKARNTRNTLMNACKDIIDGIKSKVDNFRAECVRKAEEEKKRIADELKAKEEKKKRIEEEKFQDELESKRKAEEPEAKIFCEFHHIYYPAKMKYCPECATMTPGADVEATCKHGKYPDETCKECGQRGEIKNDTNDMPPQDAINTIATTTTIPPQKSKEGQNGPITQEKQKGTPKCKVVDIKALCGGIACGMIPTTCIRPHMEELNRFAKLFSDNSKPGDDFFPGCEIIFEGD